MNENIDALEFLKQDHQRIRALFANPAEAGDDNARLAAIGRGLGALAIHSAIEEQLFYPAARALLVEPKIVDAASADHAAWRRVMDEIAEARDVAVRAEKFDALARLVDEHIDREERDIIPRCMGWRREFPDLGVQLAEASDELRRVAPFL